jgi:hypothetical protein
VLNLQAKNMKGRHPAGAVWVGKFWMCGIKHFVCITSIRIQKTIYNCMYELAFVIHEMTNLSILLKISHTQTAQSCSFFTSSFQN